jgi:hypothetical protein
MHKRILAMLTLSAAMVALPLFAQQNNPPASDPGQPSAVAKTSDPASSPAEAVRVTGTITLLADSRIEVKIDRAETQAAGGSVATVGKTEVYTLDSMTDKPLDLKVGDHVDLWFTQHGHDHLATRIALAGVEGTSSQTGGAGGMGTTSPASDTASQASSQESQPANPTSTGSMTTSASPTSESASQVSSQETQPTDATTASSVNTSQPSGSQAEVGTAPRGNLPKTASELPLVGVIGLVALCAALMLRFTVKS